MPAACAQDESLTAVTVHLDFRLQCFAAICDYDEKAMTIMKELLPGTTEKIEISELLKAKPSMLPVPETMCGDLTNLTKAMESFQLIKNVTTVAELELAKEAWASAKSALKTFDKGLAQAARDSKSFIAQKQRDSQRQKKADERKKEQETVEQFKQQGDERARKLLESRKVSAKPVFKTAQFLYEKVMQKSASDLAGVTLKEFVQHDAVGHLADMDLPWVASEKKHDKLAKWVADAVIQKSTEAWALKYKTLPDYAQKGRCSAALESKHGHEQCEDMFSGFVPVLADFSSMGGSADFMKTNFLAGYDPKMCFAGLQANGATTLKAGLIGEVLHMVMPLAGLIAAMEKASLLKADTVLPSPEAFCELVEALDLKAVTELCRHGLEIYYHKQLPGELLCVPMGWFCIEISMNGLVVVCIRKGIFPQKASEKSLDQYKSLKDLFKRCGKKVERYDQAIALMTPKSDN